MCVSPGSQTTMKHVWCKEDAAAIRSHVQHTRWRQKRAASKLSNIIYAVIHADQTALVPPIKRVL